MDMNGKRVWLAGLGKSGRSALPWLLRLGANVHAADSRPAPGDAGELQARYPGVAFHYGPFRPDLFLDADLLVVSPGIPWETAAFKAARAAGIPLLGDLELFGHLARAPIAAITGSNGKSTTTTLLGEMAQAAGLAVRVGGNLGTPALDLLPTDEPEPDLYVVEVSSFQLMACTEFQPRYATILNLSPDHLDWHGSLQDYGTAKARIFARMGAGDTLVLNARDEAVMALQAAVPPGVRVVTFGAEHRGTPGSIRETRQDRGVFLVEDGPGGERTLMPASEIPLAGEHNRENVMAALALALAAGIPLQPARAAIRGFRGLPHRMELVARVGGVEYYDDSKGTNLGATLKAMGGLPGPLVMILGGDAKGADLTPLRDACRGQRAAVVIGKDAPVIATLLDGVLPVVRATDMSDALDKASRLALSGDQVLLSPACASLDMFRDYQDRGRQFQAAVRALKDREVRT